MESIVTELILKVVQVVGTALAVQLISLLSPVGWLGQLVRGVYKGITFIIDNFKKIEAIFAQAKALLKGAIEGAAPAETAKGVEGLLRRRRRWRRCWTRSRS